jgi:hypothetical protein
MSMPFSLEQFKQSKFTKMLVKNHRFEFGCIIPIETPLVAAGSILPCEERNFKQKGKYCCLISATSQGK